MATIEAPRDVTARHRDSVAFIQVTIDDNDVPEVQYDDNGAWTEATKCVTGYLVPVPEAAEVPWRARLRRGRLLSPWTTGTVTGRSLATDDPPEVEPPQAPTDLRTTWATRTSVTLAWRQDGDVDGWRVSVRTDPGGEVVHDSVTDIPTLRVDDLPVEQGLQVEVRSRRGSDTLGAVIESDLLALTLPSADTPPLPAADVFCVPGHTTLSLSWDQWDTASEWLVLWAPVGTADLASMVTERATAEHLVKDTGDEREEVGSVSVSGDPQVVLTGLAADAEYDILVLTRYRGTAAPQAVTTTARTLPATPDTVRPSWLRSTSSTGSNRLEVEWEHRGDETAWEVRLDGRDPVVISASIEQPRHLWRELPVGSRHQVTVRVQVDGQWLPADTAASLWVTLPAEPPTGLCAHTIGETDAVIEWHDDPVAAGWLVWVGDDQGRAVTTLTPQVRVTDLEPATAYTVHVQVLQPEDADVTAATNGQATDEATDSEPPTPPESVSLDFVTLEVPRPPVGDLDAPRVLLARADGAGIDVSWVEARPRLDEDHYYLVRVDNGDWTPVAGHHTYLAEIGPGIHVVEVYGVFGDSITGIARKGLATPGGTA